MSVVRPGFRQVRARRALFRGRSRKAAVRSPPGLAAPRNLVHRPFAEAPRQLRHAESTASKAAAGAAIESRESAGGWIGELSLCWSFRAIVVEAREACSLPAASARFGCSSEREEGEQPGMV